MRQIKARIVGRRVTAFALCLCMVMSLISGLGLIRAVAESAGGRAAANGNGATSGATRQADPSTMDTYQQMLNFSENTRYAGRLWSDKSVFALGSADTGNRADNWKGNTLNLTKALDGVDGTINLNEDFLHVFSALGSSLEVSGVPPVRTVIVFDNSGSMYNQSPWDNTRIAKTVDAINAAIDVLMLSSQYNEVSVVLFGDGANAGDDSNNTHRYQGHNTAITILPMKHYEPSENAVKDYKDDGIIAPQNNTQYLTAGWSKGQTTVDGSKPNHDAANKGESGWVYVNNDICGLKSSGTDGEGWNGCGTNNYTAYANGTTNIQAGMYQGMQELLNASKTETVGNQTYQCVPSLVILTDGAVTDAINNWLDPSKDSTGILNDNMGFACDFSYKGVSFVERNDPRGKGTSGDINNNAWNQFLAVKGKTIDDPKGSLSDEKQKALDGTIYYEAVASADASDGKLNCVQYNYTKHDKTVNNTTKVDGNSLTAMQNLANQYRDDEAYMIFNYLLTTAYYKQAVKSAYKVSDTDDWSLYTITVDMPDPETEGFHAGFEGNVATEAAITSNPVMMNPGKFFNTKWLKSSGYLSQDGDVENNTYYDDYTVGDMTVEGIQKAIQAWEDWKSGKDAKALGLTTFRTIQGSYNFNDNKIKDKIKVYDNGTPVDQDDTHTFTNYLGPNHNSFWRVYATQELGEGTGKGDFYIPTLAEAEEAAKKKGFTLADMDYDYATLAYYAKVSGGSGAELANVFVDIIGAITEHLFAPVGGANDLGVDDALTYVDPIGKYMDVKDVDSLSLFGTLYDIVKTAVYDYQWNHQYIENLKDGTEALDEGWYKGDPIPGDNTGVEKHTPTKPDGTDYYPPGCKDIDDAWAQGWVYRVNYKTASRYVPTLATINEGTEQDATTAKQQHTVYTFYRIAGDKGGDPMSNEYLTALHMNPAYGDSVPDNAPEYDEQNQEHLETPGVYALIDIRIWTEDSGDYTDDTLGDTLTDTNYDEALWVNVPVNMLPLRTVSINLGKTVEGDGSKWEYSTNIPTNTDTLTPAESASFPLRLFYTVGVSDEVLEASNRVNIAGAISAEYIKENKVASEAAEKVRNLVQGNLEFFSNWYNPLNRYSDYATTSMDYTYGDPVVSFSPSKDNRYYSFEKALPLYEAAYRYCDDETTKAWQRVVVEGDTLTEGVTGYNTSATGFGGRLIAQDLDATAEEISGKLPKDITPKEGDIVFLKKDRLTDVEVKEGQKDPFPSDGYYFLAIEYYQLGDNATWAQQAITRRGSEFGSGYGAANITNGDMLCWHDMSGKNEDKPYVSYTEEGDKTRGKPKEAGEWVVSAKKGGLRVGDLAQNIQNKGGTYTSMDAATMEAFSAERYPGNESANGLNWGYYAQNVTRTANNYYMPTISTASSLGENNDIIVNVYLGNNGRLYVSDTTLLVTKQVELAEGMTVENLKDKEFNFQIFINGINTGESVKQSAIVIHIHWNKDTETWTWQRQFHTIDLELDGQLFLQTADGAKAMVDKDGNQVVSSGGGYQYADGSGAFSGGTVYYVYIGKNRGAAEVGASSTGFRVYHNDAVDSNGAVATTDVTSETDQDGKTTYKATEVWLVSASKFENWTGKDPIGDTDFKLTNDLYDTTVKDFTLLTLDPTAAGTEVAVSSPYRTASAYWSKELTFGVNSNEDDGPGTVGSPLTKDDLYDQIIPVADRPDYFADLNNNTIAKNTAEFTLKDGEGLLLSGISSNSVYRVTEKLSKEDMEAGYTLKQVSHNQQVGSTSTYQPGKQEIPVYYNKGTTYGAFYPDAPQKSQLSTYLNSATEKGLTWALDKDGAENDKAYLHTEPFHHTNAIVAEAYSTMDKDAAGDNHHQPAGFLAAGKNGRSPFYLWDESKQTSTSVSETFRHTVGDNPSCKPLAQGGCDDEIEGNQVRHYFFKDGELLDVHYQGEGSGFIRNIGRYITSPTVHFAVEDETEAYAKTEMAKFTQSTDYTGAYSVFGNTGTYEESANFINTVEPGTLSVTKELAPKEKLTDEDKEKLTDEDKAKSFDFTLTLTKPDPDTGIKGPAGGYPYTITIKDKDASGEEEIKTIKSGLLLPSTGTAGDNNIVADPEGTWKFQLKGGETFTVGMIPGKTAYTVTEADAKGFKTEVKVGEAAAQTASTATGTIAPGEAKKTEILFTNTKDKPDFLSLNKTLTVKLYGGAQLEGDFVFTVTPDKGNDKKSDPIRKRDGFDEKTGLTLTMHFNTADAVGDVLKETLKIFKEEEFTQKGEYTYEIAEQTTAIPGMKYDDRVYTATVNVTRESSAVGEQAKLKAELTLTLKSSGETVNQLTFANDYDVARAGQTFTVTKELTDAAGNQVTLKGGEFSFTLTAGECEYKDTVGGKGTSPMPKGAEGSSYTVTNAEGGDVYFGEVEYTRPGEYKYTIKEVADPTSDAPFTYGYDETVYDVTVTVTRQGDGSLKAEAAYKKHDAPEESVFSAAFKNTVKLGGLTVTKTVTGESGEKTRDFSFTVTFTDKDGNPPTDATWRRYAQIVVGASYPGTLSWTGTYSWKSPNVLEFTLKHGESLTVTGLPVGMKYAVQENPPADRDYKVEYENESGTIKDKENVKVSVTNKAPNIYPFPLQLVKKLTLQPGSDGVDVHGVFTFTVTPADGNPADDPLKGAVRRLTTDDIAVGQTGVLEIFTKEDKFGTLHGKYTYTVKEERGNIPGVNYDSRYYTVTVQMEEYLLEPYHLYALIPTVTITDRNGETVVYNKKSDGAPVVLDFENTYNAYEITAAIEAWKTLKDGVLHKDQFQFELTAGKEEKTRKTSPMPEGAVGNSLTKSNTEGGFVSFGDIKYTEPGKYHYTLKEYTLKEIPGADKSVEYDGKTYDVVVTVERASTGELTAKVTYDGEDKAEFTNTQKTGSLTVKKTVAGEGGETGRAFEFTVTFGDKDNPPTDATWRRYVRIVVGASYPGTLSWTGTYRWSGPNELVITLTHGESLTVSGIPAGMQYEVTETPVDGYRTDVTVDEKKENNTYTATGVIPTDGTASVEVTFTNTKDTPALLSLEKKLNMTVYGGAAFTGDFAFIVKPGDDNDKNSDPIQKRTDFKNGVLTLTIPFNTSEPGPITKTLAIFDKDAFTHEGTYTYTIRELTSDIPGVRYDDRVYTATVDVKKKSGTGADPDQLKATLTLTLDGEEVEKLAFENDYVAARTDLELTAQKHLKDAAGNELALKGGEFSFTLTAENCTYFDDVRVPGTSPMPAGASGTEITVQNAPDGSVSFSSIEFMRPGIYHYTVQERNPGDDGNMIYDETEYAVVVTVDRDTETGELTAKVTYNGEAQAEFTNIRKPGGLVVSKNVTGLGNKDKEFHFTVTFTPAEGLERAVITKNGSPLEAEIKNGKLEFTLKHGEYVEITGLPAGTEYLVTEDDYTEEGYTTSSSNASGIIPPNGTANAAFVNDRQESKEPGEGNLKVSKTVTGEGDTNKEFHFTVTLSGVSVGGTKGEEITGQFGDLYFTNGVAEFTLKHGQSAAATGLPAGITYVVTEDDYTKEDYDTSEHGEPKGIIPDGGTAEASYVNDFGKVLEPKERALQVTKTVLGDAGETEREWHFTVTLYNKDGEVDTSVNGPHGGMTFTNGVAEFTLKSGESALAESLPEGDTYEVVEKEANQDGYTTTVTGGTGTITENGTANADFVNRKDPPPEENTGNLTVSKTVTGNAGDKSKEWNFHVELSDKTVTGTYGGMTFRNGIADFILKDGESLTANGLPAGITYKVTEAEANADGYHTTIAGDEGIIPDGGTARADFVNSKSDEPGPEKGNLTVTKLVSGTAGDTGKEWHFRVELSDKTVNGAYGGMTFTNGVAEFTLKHNQSLTAEGLPNGITYTVTETEANADGYDTTSTGASGTIPENGTANADFVNSKDAPGPELGGLTVSKTVTGGDTAKDWHFTVKLSDTSVNGIYGGMFFTNGVAEFTLKHGESMTAEGLPAGITYTVTEFEAGKDGYTTVPTVGNGTIPAGDMAEAKFANYKDTTTKKGNLTVTKTVTGEGDTSKEWHFRVELSDKTVNGKYGEMEFTNGVATFTLKHGQSLTATGLPAGITYTVTETEANQDGYITTPSGESGTIPENDTARTEFTNYKDEKTKNPGTGNLTVTKTVTAGDLEKEWHFTVSLSDTTISGTYGEMTFTSGVATFTLKSGDTITATGLPAGITYTVTEKEANQDGYTTTSTGSGGTIEEGKTSRAEFFNRNDTTTTTETGGLTVSKTVTGTAGDTAKDWHFTVKLSDTTVNGIYGGMFFVNGVAEFTLKSGKSMTAEGLPAGITYTVTEFEANADGYDTTATDASGAIPANGQAEAKFVNSKDATEPKFGDLTVSKTVTGTAGDTSKEWHFRVELSDKTVNGTYGGMTFTNGIADFTLKHGESKTAEGLPAGITYTVTEAEANEDDYTTGSTGFVGTIPADGEAEAKFTNHKDDTTTPKTGNLTVSKTVTGTAGSTTKDWHFTVTLSDTTVNGAYGGMTFTDGVANFDLKHGESLTATGLPAGITYTVTETEANADGYHTASAGSEGTIPDGGTARADFVNSKSEEPGPNLGNLTVTKLVSGTAGDMDKEWHFTVTLSDTTISGTYGEMTFTNGVAEFTLKHTQSLTATGLPAGVTYTVTETEANADGYDTKASGESGTIPENGTANADFVNSKDDTTTPKTGNLTVSKTVTGTAGDTGKEWHFTVTLSDATISGTYGGMTFTNGVATFTLKHGESLTANGLPAGITYTVTEEEADKDDYHTASVGSEGTIPDGGTARADFVNSKSDEPGPNLGNLTVTKLVSGTAGGTDKAWHFTVTLSDASVNGIYGGMFFTNGVAEFTLKHGQSLTAEGLPAGITYTVTEFEADKDGYTTTSTDSSGTIPENGTAEAKFENSKDTTTTPKTGNLTVRKTVTGTEGDKSKEWNFRVELSDKTVNGAYGGMTFTDGVAEFTLKHGESVTATGLPAGITYTVTETEANADDYTTGSTGFAGTIPADGTAEAKFTNSKGDTTTPKTGSLTVSKTVTGTGDKSKEWHFRVELSDKSVNGDFGEMTFRNGVAEFTLKHNQSLTATGLPAGITYTVSEEEANKDDYITRSTGFAGTIPANGEAEAKFTNHKGDTTTPKTGGLTVSKTVAGTAGDKSKEWHFRVELSDRTVNGAYGGMTFTDGVANFDLKHGESLTATGLPAGITYTVTETVANADGYHTASAGDKGIIPDGGTAQADFLNSKSTVTEPGTGNLTVTKLVSGTAGDTSKEWHFTVTLSGEAADGTPAADIDGKYGDMFFVNGVANFTLTHKQSVTATGLPAGITYTVTETEANADGYDTNSTGASGTIPENDTANADFVNSKDGTTTTPKTGSLTVSKTVTGGEVADGEVKFHFTVTLSGEAADGTPAADINGKYGDMFFVNGVAQFDLTDGERKTASGLPAGLDYTVTEVPTAGFTPIQPEGGSTEGIIPGNGTAKADFVNRKDTVTKKNPEPGSLTVTKTVTGDAGDTNKEFHFTVTLKGEGSDITGTFGGMTFTNGVAAFTLKSGESVTAEGLPAGVGYKVTETEANKDGYTTEMTGDRGTISEDTAVWANFINHKDPPPEKSEGDLVVTKTVEGDAGDINKEFHFTVTLEGDGSNITGTYGGMTFRNGVAEFTLKHGQSKTAKGLPAGLKYTVTETEANQDGYYTYSPGDKGTIPDGDTARADFVNAMDPGLTVEKMVINPTEEDLSKDWHFAVKLEPPAGNPINWETLVWHHSGGRPVEIDRENNTLRFVLRHGEHVRFGNIPQNTHYMVTEAEANVDPFKTTVDPTFSPAEGLIRLDPEVWVRFLNERSGKPDEPTPGNGSLQVEKHVSGATGEMNREWHFRVELSQPLTGWYGNMYFVNGVAEFTLKDGESLTARGLPAGVTYTVTEVEANRDGYTTETSGETGTIPDGGTAEAWFINSRDETPPTEPDDTTPEPDDTTPGPDDTTPGPDDTTPEPDNPPETPKTGDDSHLGLWAALMILSLAGVAATSLSLFGRRSFAGTGKWRVASFKGKHLRK